VGLGVGVDAAITVSAIEDVLVVVPNESFTLYKSNSFQFYLPLH
jgi:hypothetical protein